MSKTLQAVARQTVAEGADSARPIFIHPETVMRTAERNGCACGTALYILQSAPKNVTRFGLATAQNIRVKI